MKNIDMMLVDAKIKSEMHGIKQDLDQRLSEAQVMSLIENMIKGQFEKAILDRVHKIFSASSNEFVINLIDGLLESKMFLRRLRTKIRNKICEDLDY